MIGNLFRVITSLIAFAFAVLLWTLKKEEER